MLFLGAGLAVSSYKGKGEGLPAAEVPTQPLLRDLPEQSCLCFNLYLLFLVSRQKVAV